MTNKKYQHQRSVETLSLSGYGSSPLSHMVSSRNDECIIAEIQTLINSHTQKQPYSRNTLLRIKDKVDRYLLVRAGEGESV